MIFHLLLLGRLTSALLNILMVVLSANITIFNGLVTHASQLFTGSHHPFPGKKMVLNKGPVVLTAGQSFRSMSFQG